MGIFHKSVHTSASTISDIEKRKIDIVLQNVVDGVVIIDFRGLVKLINPSALEMTGYATSGDAIGLNYATVLNLFDKTGASLREGKTALAEAFQKNKSFQSYDYNLIPQNDKQKIVVSLTLSPTSEDDQGDRMIIFRDVTAIAKNNTEQMEFIATASHEMRTPVASIEGYLSLALNPQTATIDERAQKYLNEAHQACKHLGDLFRDLLDVTKIAGGNMQLHLVPVEITQTIHSLLDGYNTEEVVKKQQQLSFGNPNQDNTTIIRQPLYCAVDMNLLNEIFNNLLENAIKYTPEKGQVRINVLGDRNRVIISIADTGIGIGSNDLPHIFQRFYRVDNSDTRTIGGTGLGLYLVKKQTESLGGQVWVESQPGKGSTFYVALPRLSSEEYERMRIVVTNAESLAAHQAQQLQMQNNNQPQGGNNG